jgi:hypothetical protein
MQQQIRDDARPPLSPPACRQCSRYAHR